MSYDVLSVKIRPTVSQSAANKQLKNISSKTYVRRELPFRAAELLNGSNSLLWCCFDYLALSVWCEQYTYILYSVHCNGIRREFLYCRLLV